VSARITNITGGEIGKECRGVNLAMFFAKPTVTNGEYDQYVRSVMEARI
jgi:hypothetical protein